MAICSHPTCTCNDEYNDDDDDLFMEYMETDDTWVPVCRAHVDRTNLHVELTDETRTMDGDELLEAAT